MPSDHSSDGSTRDGITRSQLLKGAAASMPALMLGGAARDALAAGGPEALAAATSLRGMNVVMFITDQQRAIQHFPTGWAEQNLPGLTRLKQQRPHVRERLHQRVHVLALARDADVRVLPGPARVKYTLETDMPAPQYPQVELSTGLQEPRLA